jgi:hypothetical protein
MCTHTLIQRKTQKGER